MPWVSVKGYTGTALAPDDLIRPITPPDTTRPSSRILAFSRTPATTLPGPANSHIFPLRSLLHHAAPSDTFTSFHSRRHQSILHLSIPIEKPPLGRLPASLVHDLVRPLVSIAKRLVTVTLPHHGHEAVIIVLGKGLYVDTTVGSQASPHVARDLRPRGVLCDSDGGCYLLDG